MLTGTRSRIAVAAFALLVAIAASALRASAHDAEAGPHGGQMIEVKGHHLEMTAKGNELIFYLFDAAHAAIASRGASGRVVILDGSRQSSAPLAALDPDRLVARLEAPLAPGARVVVTAKLAGGHDIVARFVVR
ncbi:MAG: hypothetical protein NW223_21885 [Hyphomicrobiaceae bacterium]|nr:hypothetical protein [Hyphomicrobiaceae bacterium]